LNTLASSVGLLTQNDIENMKITKERNELLYPAMMPDQTKLRSKSTGNMSKVATPLKPRTMSRRLNEPLNTGRSSRKSSRNTGYRLNTGNNNNKYIVDQNEREIWMLQVLCQILQTENLAEVQSWLVSASDSEKDRIKVMIDHAMKGLEESGRIEENENSGNTIKTAASRGTLPPQSKQSNLITAFLDVNNNNSNNNTNNETTGLNSITNIESTIERFKNNLKLKTPNQIKSNLTSNSAPTLIESHNGQTRAEVFTLDDHDDYPIDDTIHNNNEKRTKFINLNKSGQLNVIPEVASSKENDGIFIEFSLLISTVFNS
jgi:hypothetical protein